MKPMSIPATRTFGWRDWLLLAIAAVVCLGLVLHGPIHQDQDYHRFADARGLWGLPNFLNVVSNLPFLVFGAWGLATLYRKRSTRLPMRTAHIVFFLGSAWVAFGSAYYHMAPSDQTLVWDRLPMTVAFMAFFAALLGRYIHPVLGGRALIPLLALGLLSVVWWRIVGDLRPYLMVQFLPILLIPAILLLYPVSAPGTRYIWAVLGVYVLAKVLEIFDPQIYAAFGMSGHSLKHVAAAFGVYGVMLAVRAEMGEPRAA
jgi:Ceramidase